MLRVLFVTTTIPFPPRQGIELPNAYIAEALSKAFSMDLLVITRSQEDDKIFEQRRHNVPTTVKRLLRVRCYERSSLAKLFQELTLQCPSYFIGGYETQMLKDLFNSTSYDAVWVSPVGALGLLRACRRLGLVVAPFVALGCNDVITTTYLDSLKEWLSGRMFFSLRRFFQGLRSVVIWSLEKRYLQTVDLLQVQTFLEKHRARWLLGRQARQPYVLAAQNGRKQELEKVCYNCKTPKTVLYMTHLKGGRASESRWFLRKVWPRILRQHPDAKLLLAGTPPQPDSKIARSLPPEAEVLGYVDDLVELYESVTVAVVPIIHSTGLINRALDALTAGVPLVATSAVLSTIAGCESGRDAIAADSVGQFSEAVCTLLENSDLRQAYSLAGRALAQKQPTWKQSTDTITSVLVELSKSQPSVART